MSETNWISLSERKPTEADADQNGYVWVNLPGYDRAQLNYYLNLTPEAIDFMPIPKRVVPPLPPKPVEKTQHQRELDEEKLKELLKRPDVNLTDCLLDAMQWARAEERKRFAAQCLGLFNSYSTPGLELIAELYEQRGFVGTATAIRALHKLLTEAAAKP